MMGGLDSFLRYMKLREARSMKTAVSHDGHGRLEGYLKYPHTLPDWLDGTERLVMYS